MVDEPHLQPHVDAGELPRFVEVAVPDTQPAACEKGEKRGRVAAGVGALSDWLPLANTHQASSRAAPARERAGGKGPSQGS